MTSSVGSEGAGADHMVDGLRKWKSADNRPPGSAAQDPPQRCPATHAQCLPLKQKLNNDADQNFYFKMRMCYVTRGGKVYCYSVDFSGICTLLEDLRISFYLIYPNMGSHGVSLECHIITNTYLM